VGVATAARFSRTVQDKMLKGVTPLVGKTGQIGLFKET
jgi:hypothetical protein